MANLGTKYMGIHLKNPVVVGSSGLTSSLAKIKALEQHGAGAVVLKSLFEEQIKHETGKLVWSANYPEANDYLSVYTRKNSLDKYLGLIQDAKEATTIPIIASINCLGIDEWLEFAKKIEEAGADAIEVNIYVLPTNKNAQKNEYENLYFDLAGKINQAINKPVIFKLGSQFTNILALVNRIHAAGINGVVLFNRFFQPDIDIDNLKLVSAGTFSSPTDMLPSLRWIAMLHDKIPKIDLAASTGIHDGKAVIKQLLAGAKVAQVCTTLYKNGPAHLETIIQEIEKWMEDRGFTSIDQFRGMLSYKSIPDPTVYERSQFMKYFSGLE